MSIRMLGFLVCLCHWLTYISMEVGDYLRVYDLMMDDSRSWRAFDVTRLFDSHLAERILATPMPGSEGVGLSMLLKGIVRNLVELSRTVLDRRIQFAWM